MRKFVPDKNKICYVRIDDIGGLFVSKTANGATVQIYDHNGKNMFNFNWFKDEDEAKKWAADLIFEIEQNQSEEKPNRKRLIRVEDETA